MTSANFTIRNLNSSEVKLAVDWAAKEGWNPGINDAELFYLADPDGFYGVEYQGQIIGVGSAVAYDPNFAFCGLYIVHPDYRGQGYGLALTHHRLNYCGERNVGIDGVLENVEIYKRVGYVPYYQNRRYQGNAKADQTMFREITDLSNIGFEQIKRYDSQCFPAPRDAFLKAWISQPQSRALAYIEDAQLKGYAVRRQCIEGHKIGPLYADSEQIAQKLFASLQTDVDGEAIFLDIPDNNQAAISLAEKTGMEIAFATARMYKKGLPDIAMDKIYGVCTFELG